MTKRTVFLTGATGTMGFAGLQELLRYPEQYKVRILARPSKKNQQLLAPYLTQVEVIWGDLTRYADVLKGVEGSDIVLHVGGMVSPQADYRPNATFRTNLTAALNIRRAVIAQGDQQPIVVYIGSVAQMGDRREPLHWGRTGDPICVSAYDHYGITKALSERLLTDGSIRRWVSLRQSGILYPAILKNYDPIMFHVPIRGVLEWATVEDSGRLLERVCRTDIPDEFWNRYYNIGSGKEYRLSNYEFECLLLEAIGCPKPEQIFESRWFTTRNFHGMWYLDGDELEHYLHFRANIPVREYFEQMSNSPSLPSAIRFAKRTRIAKLVPHIVKLSMRAMAHKAVHGTQTWIKEAEEGKRVGQQRVAAYYGSLEQFNSIPDWKGMDLSHPTEQPVVLSHGYDETKPLVDFTLADMQQAAAYRGGMCLSKEMVQGDLDTPLEWQCAEGHRFKASPRLILLGGHWCPECFPFPYHNANLDGLEEAGIPTYTRPWQWDNEAKRNPFFAQLWQPLHDNEENNTYGANVFDGWEKSK
ncbi:MAG: NAD-dependent epimerase/dehydratase family protein [Paludibacteraceae bacterium]|nr:NAD-dependent epimerase/dehydratase family protein [Paludibacteraceae bacterium]